MTISSRPPSSFWSDRLRAAVRHSAVLRDRKDCSRLSQAAVLNTLADNCAENGTVSDRMPVRLPDGTEEWRMTTLETIGLQSAGQSKRAAKRAIDALVDADLLEVTPLSGYAPRYRIKVENLIVRACRPSTGKPVVPSTHARPSYPCQADTPPEDGPSPPHGQADPPTPPHTDTPLLMDSKSRDSKKGVSMPASGAALPPGRSHTSEDLDQAIEAIEPAPPTPRSPSPILISSGRGTLPTPAEHLEPAPSVGPVSRASMSPPDGWKPSDKVLRRAAEDGFSAERVDEELRKFLAYERRKPVKNWNTAFANWLKHANKASDDEIARFLTFWGKRWSEHYRDAYVGADIDRKHAGRVIFAAKETAHKHGFSPQDVAKHWVASYLDEHSTKRHPLMFLVSNIPTLGLPRVTPSYRPLTQQVAAPPPFRFAEAV